MKKNCRACQGYPTCRGETTRPPKLSRPPRRVTKGWLFCKEISEKLAQPGQLAGRVVLGTLDHRNGPLECFPLCQRFRKFRSEVKRRGPFRYIPGYSGPPLEVVHFDRSDRSDRNLPFHFDKPVHCPTSL